MKLLAATRIAARPAVLSRTEVQDVEASLAQVFAQVTGRSAAFNPLLGIRPS